MINNHLEHHGILGQRWGVRRYETKDGHLTEAGKKRYKTDGKNLSDEELRRRVNRMRDEERYKDLTVGKSSNNGKTVKDLSYSANSIAKASGNKKAHEVAKAAGKIAESGSKIAGKVSEKNTQKKRSEIDLSHLSDKELRAKVQRLEMEKQYDDLNQGRVKKGSDAVRETLEVAGAVVGLGLGAAKLGKMIYDLKKGA